MSSSSKLSELTTAVVSAYVRNNATAPADLHGLIQSIYASLSSVGEPAPAPPESSKATPAEIKKSISPEALISFEDGKPYKALKRHLTRLGMTMDDYKSKWGLPYDYPAVANGYSARRSEVAKTAGLGQKRTKPVEQIATEMPAEEVAIEAAKTKPNLSPGNPNPKKSKAIPNL